MTAKQKRIKLRQGCYVQKLIKDDFDPSATVFQCNSIYHGQHADHCTIKPIAVPTNTCTKPIAVPKNTLIPQTALYYHKDCLKHSPLNPTDDHPHPERPARVSEPMFFLHDYGLLDKCVVIKPKEAKMYQIELTHSKAHLAHILSTHSKALKHIEGTASSDDDVDMEQNDDDLPIGLFNTDTYYNQHSARASKLACGAAIGLCKNILNKRCRNGIAIVRPPGHHCEHDIPMGFCLFNNVAVAANVMKAKNLCKKILIVDWDLHHGNGTQNMFYDDKDVLYFSVHRHDNGRFYPYSGKIKEHGRGYNINVPLNRISDEGARYGDAAYLDIWKCILLPIAMDFQPDIIIISAGFDACIEDPLNNDVMAISPPCYGVLCRMLMNVSPNVAVVLEGGYNLDTMSPAIAYVTWALLRGPIDDIYEDFSLHDYKNNKQVLELYVENTLWYKSIFFEYEFKRFVLAKIENGHGFEQFYQCNKEYDDEQKQDLTKHARRKIMKKVLFQHSKYWPVLKPLRDYFFRKY